MGLITCPDCGGEISDQAPSRPKCGRPFATQVTSDGVRAARSLSPQRIAVLICAIVGLAATFLPWANMGPLAVAGTQGDGWITFVLFAVAAGLAVAGDRHSDLKLPSWAGTLLAGAAAAFVAAWHILRISKGNSDLDVPAVAAGIGLYLAVLAGVALVVVVNVVSQRKQ